MSLHQHREIQWCKVHSRSAAIEADWWAGRILFFPFGITVMVSVVAPSRAFNQNGSGRMKLKVGTKPEQYVDGNQIFNLLQLVIMQWFKCIHLFNIHGTTTITYRRSCPNYRAGTLGFIWSTSWKLYIYNLELEEAFSCPIIKKHIYTDGTQSSLLLKHLAAVSLNCDGLVMRVDVRPGGKTAKCRQY